MKVVIDPVDDILYMSFYVYGLQKVLGSGNVKFSSAPFSSLSTVARHTKSTRFIIEKDGKERKYVIHCDDTYQIHEELYNWCDVYGCVNTNFAKTPEAFHKRLVSLCPSFGMRCWNWPQTLFHAFANLPKDGTSMRKFLGKHKRLLDRPVYSDYVSKASVDDDYVFFLSTLWYSDEWNKNDEGVNARRANFVRACKGLDNVYFEGGLVSQGKERSSEDLFADCLCGGIPMKEWMEKTKRSLLVFNTPAFWDCHGWKLGEYLAMGKCIVSTELSNDLPEPLEHGKNIHFVENSQESMRDAVDYIVSHPEYRKKLEQGARAYWETYGTPIASLKLLGIGK
jgi:hypothetical protein